MKHFFNDPLIIYASQTHDEYGRQIWTDGVAVNGRFVEKNKVLYSGKDASVVSDALIHVPAETDISVGSKLVFDSTKYRVIQLNKPKDGGGTVRFIKAYLQLFNENE